MVRNVEIQWKIVKNSIYLPLYDEKLVVFGFGGSFGVVSPGEKQGDEPDELKKTTNEL